MPHSEPLRVSDLQLVGSHVALDFCNTVGNRDTEAPTERLHTYADVVEWSVRAEVISADYASELLDRAERHPDQALEAFESGLRVRDVLFRVFSQLALSPESRGSEQTADPFEGLNRELSLVLPHLRLEASGDGGTWAWEQGDIHFQSMLWPIVWEACRLVTSADIERVKMCADATCGWLFLDESRNQARRWCDMERCGTRNKVRRFRERRRDD